MSISRNLAALTGLFVVLCCATAVAQPANDNCAAAIPISEGTGISFDTTGAAVEVPAGCGSSTQSPDVWYSFVASCTGFAAIETTSFVAATNNGDTIISVFDTCGGANLGCDDDDGPGFLSALNVPVVSGTSYLIRLSGWSGSTGSGTFDLTCYAPPANDDCAGAISVAPFVATPFTTAGSTSTTPSITGCTGTNDVWYEFTPASTGNHGIALTNLVWVVGEGTTTTSVRPGIYTNPGGGVCPTSVNQVGTCPTGASAIASLTAGTSYLIRIRQNTTLATADPRQSGNITISEPVPEVCTDFVDNDLDGTVDCLDADCAGDPACAPPANDLCTGAIPLSPFVAAPFSTYTGTDSVPAYTCQGSRDVWYEYTATVAGAHSVDLSALVAVVGTSTDTNHGVYNNPGGGICPTDADQVACIATATGSATFVAGNSYLIRVGMATSVAAASRAAGNITVTPPPVNDECATAIPAVLGVNAFDNRASNNSAVTAVPDCSNTVINNDVFYTYTPPATGTLVVYTCGGIIFATGSSDTEVSVYTGACGALACSFGNDDAGAACTGIGGLTAQSFTSGTVTGGVPLTIRVGSFSSTANVEGTGTFVIDFFVPGDECANAISVIAGANPIDTSTYTDSAEPDPTGCTNDYGQNVQDGWYAYTVPAAGAITVDTCDPAGFDTDLAIYSGSCSSLSLLACDGDGNTAAGCQGFDSRISNLPVVAGTHLIRVGGWSAGESGPGLLNITFSASAPEICNDLLDNDFDGFTDCADPDCAADVACLACPTFVTQNTDPDNVTVNIAACAAGPNHTENGYFRSFDTSTATFANCPNGVRVTAVEYGLGTNTTTPVGGTQGARIRLWLDSNGGAPDAGMTLMSEEILSITDATPTGVVVVPLTTPAVYPADATVVAEFFMEDGTVPLNILRMGGNAAGNSATAYIHAPGCGIAYTLLTALGVTTAPILNLVIDDQGAGPAGDECIFAVNVGVGANPIDTGGYTDSADPDPTGCPSFYGQNTHDGWYSFTAPGDGSISVDTCDAAGFDTDLAIYGGGCGALSLIACNGDGSGLSGCQIFYSRITNLVVEGGESYIIRIGGYDSAESGPGTLNIAFTPTPPALNELRVDQPGTDNDEFVELAGQAQSLTGMWIIVIGDGSPAPNYGVVESVIDLTGASIDSSGFFVVAEDSFTLAGGVADLEFPAASNVLNFENSDNVTFLLVRDFTGALAQDLDTNDDGVLETSPWSEVVDCVSLIETVGSGALVYCSNQVGPDGTFAPGAAERCPDATGDFFVGAFDTLLLTDTPGSSNSCLTPPSNDECVTAVEAFVGDNDFFNASATNSPEPFGQTDPGCGTAIGHDIWFHFTAPGNGTVVLDTCGLITFDSNVEMYSGTCGALVVVGGSCDTAGCPGFSATSAPIPVSGGSIYLIRVGAWNADPGGYGTLAISFNPQGDECDDPITAVDGVNAFDTTSFTNSADAFNDAQCVGTFLGAMAKDGWYSYTASIDGTMDVSLCGGSTHDSDLVIYTGACGALTQIACNGDACSLTSEILDVPVTTGTTYTIRLGSWSPSSLGAAGTFTVAVAPLAVPPTAAFTVGPLEGIAPLDVVLTDASDNGLDPAATIDIAWGDGANDNDLPVGSVVNHTYAAGTWTAGVTITNLVGSDSLLSPPIVAVAMGDCNKDGSLDVADAIGLAAYLFSGGATPNCLTACDTNGDGVLDLADAVYTLMWLFSGGSPPVPAAPGSGC